MHGPRRCGLIAPSLPNLDHERRVGVADTGTNCRFPRDGCSTLRRVDDFGRQRTRERLGYIEALVVAQERRKEVMEAIEASEDATEALTRLATLLGLADERNATVVLDMQMRRWTRQDRLRIRQERDELREALGEPG